MSTTARDEAADVVAAQIEEFLRTLKLPQAFHEEVAKRVLDAIPAPVLARYAIERGVFERSTLDPCGNLYWVSVGGES